MFIFYFRSKEQFVNSPDLKNEIMNAIIDAFKAHTTLDQPLAAESKESYKL